MELKHEMELILFLFFSISEMHRNLNREGIPGEKFRGQRHLFLFSLNNVVVLIHKFHYEKIMPFNQPFFK